MKSVTGFLAAWLCTYVLGAVFVSQGNLARVSELGLAVDSSVRIDAAWHDVTHMYDAYLPLVLAALLIGFIVCAFIARRLPAQRVLLFPLAGFVAMLVMQLTMNAVFDMTPIAPTRTVAGLLLQGIAGAAGGYIFLLTSRSLHKGT